MKPQVTILSGGPASVTTEDSPPAPEALCEGGVPMLGICYGQQLMSEQLGGKVVNGDHSEFGRAFIEIKDECPLFDGLWAPGEKHQVWMSHGDKVEALPPGFRIVGQSDGAPFAATVHDEKKYYGVQFHPEVRSEEHTSELQSLMRISYAVFCLKK